MIETIGQRIQALRCARQMTLQVSRAQLSKVENGHATPSLGWAERIIGQLDVGLARFFAPLEEFEALLALEDKFVAAVIPYLKQLNAEQQKQILATLEAAPKQKVNRMGRPLSAATR